MASKQLGSLLKSATSATAKIAEEESSKKTVEPPIRPSTMDTEIDFSVSNQGIKHKNVPLQVLIPEYVRDQVNRLCFENKESLRTTVLKGLSKLGLDIPKEDMQGRYRKQ